MEAMNNKAGNAMVEMYYDGSWIPNLIRMSVGGVFCDSNECCLVGLSACLVVDDQFCVEILVVEKSLLHAWELRHIKVLCASDC